MKYFHFTLGPVQSFVSQARRTRDFWGGSFLLSWLSAVAMKSVQVQTNNPDCVSFPKPDSNFLDYLSGIQKETVAKPIQGSIPNRFKAEVQHDFNPQLVVKDVQSAWKALAEIIFKNDLDKFAKDNTKVIWQRQIDHFWDISWVLTEDELDSSALDRRKNWRTYSPPEEAGVKCMMMDGWQELSGVERPNQNDLAQFWQTIQRCMKTDLRDHEYLCAIAFMKRRFVRHFHSLRKVDMPGGWQLSGWELPKSIPSVAYMAGVHWLEMAIEHSDEKVFSAYFDQAKNLTGSLDEWDSRITCLQKFRMTKPDFFKQWTSLDGNVFHPFVLENVNTFPDQENAQKVNQALQKLNEHVKEKYSGFTQASPFYAVLMMDGDSLGKLMSESAKQTSITCALEKFTSGVQEQVNKHNGFLIYAGGDDVLALLPLEDALQCAADLRMFYLDCFKSVGIHSTLSGAIEFAHLKIPLTKVLYDAHHLLDDIAKDKTGRDSIAVRVQKPGGVAIEWSMPWESALDDRQVVINQLAVAFRQEQGKDESFSSKFFYKIRERFDLLNPELDGKGNPILDDEGNEKIILDRKEKEDVDLMCMEYLNSGKSTVASWSEARKHVEVLLDQCRMTKRVNVNGEIKIKPESSLFADGALLVRFIAQKGIER